MTLSCHVYAQTSKSIVNQRGSFEGYIPYIKVGHNPTDISINPDTNKVYVANSLSNSVSIIDLKTMDKKDIGVGAKPSQIAINPNTNTIYVANEHSVSVIDGNNDSKKPRDILVGAEPNHIAVDPYQNTVYVIDTCPNLNTVYVINISNCVSVIDGNTE